jgi:hypothetical protein
MIGDALRFSAATGVLMKSFTSAGATPGPYPDASLYGAEGRR